MATWTNTSKRTGDTINVGNPIGLLLALTYSEGVAGATSWTEGSKSSAPTWTGASKSSAPTWTNISKS